MSIFWLRIMHQVINNRYGNSLPVNIATIIYPKESFGCISMPKNKLLWQQQYINTNYVWKAIVPYSVYVCLLAWHFGPRFSSVNFMNTKLNTQRLNFFLWYPKSMLTLVSGY